MPIRALAGGASVPTVPSRRGTVNRHDDGSEKPSTAEGSRRSPVIELIGLAAVGPASRSAR